MVQIERGKWYRYKERNDTDRKREMVLIEIEK